MDIEKKIPPKYVRGVIIKVGMTFISSQSFANIPFKNPHIENNVDDKNITASIKIMLWTVNVTKNWAAKMTTTPTDKPRITPPVMNPMRIV